MESKLEIMLWNPKWKQQLNDEDLVLISNQFLFQGMRASTRVTSTFCFRAESGLSVSIVKPWRVYRLGCPWNCYGW